MWSVYLEHIVPTVVASLIISYLGVKYFDTEKRKIKRDFIDNSRKISGNYFGSCFQYLYALIDIGEKKYSKKEINDLFLVIQKPYADLMLRFGGNIDYRHTTIAILQEKINKFYIEISNINESEIDNQAIKDLLNDVQTAMNKIERSFYNDWKNIK